MTEGPDLSRYDSAYQDDTSAVDDPRAQFVILNCDDPGVAAKAHRAVQLRKPWALYTWLYAGHGADSVTRGQAVADLLELDGLTQPPLGVFVDYEDNGVSVADAWAAFNARSAVKTRLGFYTYLYLLTSQDGLMAVWLAFEGRWLAYYPDPNDGNQKPWAAGDAQQNQSMLWQFSSTDGTRDRNVVVDAVAWARWGHSTPTPVPPAPAPPGGVMDMYVGQLDQESGVGPAYLPARTPLALAVSLGGRVFQTWAGPGPYGIPQGALDWRSVGFGRAQNQPILLDPAQLLQVVEADATTRT